VSAVSAAGAVGASREEIEAARRSARGAAELFRLPFRSRVWRGSVGSRAGMGSGSSVDFQDHRPYVPGDDPRHVDWQAYARSGNYVMKLYREEVSPAVDVVLDDSRSMSLDPDKRRRSLEAFAFALEAASRDHCAVTAWIARASQPILVDLGGFHRGEIDAFDSSDSGCGALLDRVRFRPGSLRVLVTDALFPDPPELVARSLVSGRGRGVVLAPSSRLESEPDWLGEVELTDCESGRRRHERFDEARLADYRVRYRRHFDLWQAETRRYGVAFAQLPAEETLSRALKTHALSVAAVEPAS
jgi:uncharacterized protein (DUF58 family)